jgi:hypothetical protein
MFNKVDVYLHQRCHGSPIRKVAFDRPSGLNRLGEEVKLACLGYNGERKS